MRDMTTGNTEKRTSRQTLQLLLSKGFLLLAIAAFAVILAKGSTVQAATILSPSDGETIKKLNHEVSFSIKTGYSSNRTDNLCVMIKDPSGNTVFNRDYVYEGLDTVISDSFIPTENGKYTLTTYTWYYVELQSLVNGLVKIQKLRTPSTDEKSISFVIGKSNGKPSATLTLSQQGKSAVLSITKSDADGVTVYRATSKNGKYKKLGSTKNTSYTDSSVKASKTYYYKVRPYTKNGSKTTYGSYTQAAGITIKKTVKVSADNYPYLDSDGYWHYKIKLNGDFIPVKSDALIPTADNENNEILYPVSEILDYYGVAYNLNKKTGLFSTVVNGIEVTRDPDDGTYMWYTNQEWGYGNCLAPTMINGVWYAPNHFFEHTIGATLTKIAKGQEKSRQYIDITSGSYTWGKGSKTVPVRYWNEKANKYETK